MEAWRGEDDQARFPGRRLAVTTWSVGNASASGEEWAGGVEPLGVRAVFEPLARAAEAASSAPLPRVAVLGLTPVAEALALRLHERGFRVVVYDKSPATGAALAVAGVQRCRTARHAAEVAVGLRWSAAVRAPRPSPALSHPPPHLTAPEPADAPPPVFLVAVDGEAQLRELFSQLFGGKGLRPASLASSFAVSVDRRLFLSGATVLCLTPLPPGVATSAAAAAAKRGLLFACASAGGAHGGGGHGGGAPHPHSSPPSPAAAAAAGELWFWVGGSGRALSAVAPLLTATGRGATVLGSHPCLACDPLLVGALEAMRSAATRGGCGAAGDSTETVAELEACRAAEADARARAEAAEARAVACAEAASELAGGPCSMCSAVRQESAAAIAAVKRAAADKLRAAHEAAAADRDALAAAGAEAGARRRAEAAAEDMRAALVSACEASQAAGRDAERAGRAADAAAAASAREQAAAASAAAAAAASNRLALAERRATVAEAEAAAASTLLASNAAAIASERRECHDRIARADAAARCAMEEADERVRAAAEREAGARAAAAAAADALRREKDRFAAASSALSAATEQLREAAAGAVAEARGAADAAGARAAAADAAEGRARRDAAEAAQRAADAETRAAGLAARLAASQRQVVRRFIRPERVAPRAACRRLSASRPSQDDVLMEVARTKATTGGGSGLEWGGAAPTSPKAAPRGRAAAWGHGGGQHSTRPTG